jgi:hypothetical protein
MRKCFVCKTVMYEGYLAEEYSKTFCSPECLDREFYIGLSAEISKTPVDEIGELSIFWTEWEADDEESED